MYNSFMLKGEENMEEKNNINMLYDKVDYSKYNNRVTTGQMILSVLFGLLSGALGSVLTLFFTLAFAFVLIGLTGPGGFMVTALLFIGMLVGVFYGGNYFFRRFTDVKKLRLIYTVTLVISYSFMTVWFIFF